MKLKKSKLYVIAIYFAVSCKCFSQVPVLVKDINVGANSSQPSYLTVFDGKIYFGTVFLSGLWMSDGTDAGTVKADDSTINFDSASSLLVNNNALYFNTFSSKSWWKTSGGSNNASLIRSNFQAYYKIIYSSTDLMQDVSVFVGIDYSLSGSPIQIYRSNIDDTGIVEFGGFDSINVSPSPRDIFVLNNRLVFSAIESATGRELYKSDATTATTQLIKDISMGNGSALSDVSGSNSVKIANHIYFPAFSNGVGRRIWKTDGINLGTVRIDDGVADYRDPQYLTVVGNDLYFFAASSTNPIKQLWKLPPLATHPSRMTNIAINGTAQNCGGFNTFAMGSVLYFSFDGLDGKGCELWRSDGSIAGTFRLKDINLGSTGSFPNFSLVHNGYLYFTALEASTGFEIWKTDGTLLGTTMVADINPGSASSVINNRMVEYNGELYFVADDGTHGFELFKFGFPVIDPMFSDGFEDIGPI